MIKESKYQAARLVSVVVENHFEQHHLQAQEQGEKELAPIPTAVTIEQIIDTAFWASLRREEGNSPKISLAFVPPDRTGQPMLFENPIPLNSQILTKLSPGVERPGIHLGVWHDDGVLMVWGTTLSIPNLCFVLDVSEPGLLVIKHRRISGFGKFANVAVLTGDQIKIIDEQSSALPDCPGLLRSLLGFSSPSCSKDSVNVLVQLAVSMRAHRHGGTLLIVPSDNSMWRRSIIHPLKYAVTPAYSGISQLLQMSDEDKTQSSWQINLRKELDSMAGLTAVDGATIINDQYQLLAFGAKIGRLDGNARVEQIAINEPVVGSETMIVNPAQSGGTRHLSAVQFVYDQQDAIALVASQDGHFTVFSWSESKKMVQAYRIDCLLL